MADEEEDDYMTMSFAEEPAAPAKETSLQRRERERREAQLRARPKSKAELAAEAAAARDKALATSLLDDDAQGKKKSKGAAMMAKMGFRGGALGRSDNPHAVAEPIRLSFKEDRGGVGMDSERKRKLREEMEREAAKRPKKVEAGEFRERQRLEREVARAERQLAAAQGIAERLDDEANSDGGKTGEEGGQGGDDDDGEEEEGGDDDDDAKTEQKPRRRPAAASSARPLKAINVLWRGRVRRREEAERNRRMRHDLEQGLSLSTRLPGYDDEDEDEHDKMALGKKATVYVAVEDLDDEDPELDEFDALEPAERLRRVVLYLRERFHYCFWCKYRYDDDAMEGCPGLTEEDHD